jgi:hypothetical protein
MGDLQLPDLGQCELNHVDDKEIKDTGTVASVDEDKDAASGS